VIGGYVWNDVNRDGVWQYWVEPGVNDVEVLIRNGDGSDIAPLFCAGASGPAQCTPTPISNCQQCPSWLDDDRVNHPDEANFYNFYPISVTGGDPHLTPNPPYYYAGGFAPGTPIYPYIPNPVVLHDSGLSNPERFRDLGTVWPPSEYMVETATPVFPYLYSMKSGYFEFQHMPAGNYQLVLLNTIELLETYSLYQDFRDYLLHFDYPFNLELTAPETRYLDVVLEDGEKLFIAPTLDTPSPTPAS
jgi:hypothetical protein